MIILNDYRMMSEQETGKDNIILIPITNPNYTKQILKKIS